MVAVFGILDTYRSLFQLLWRSQLPGLCSFARNSHFRLFHFFSAGNQPRWNVSSSRLIGVVVVIFPALLQTLMGGRGMTRQSRPNFFPTFQSFCCYVSATINEFLHGSSILSLFWNYSILNWIAKSLRATITKNLLTASLPLLVAANSSQRVSKLLIRQNCVWWKWLSERVTYF